MPQSETRRAHAAIIMDGNGRWAELRGLPRGAGHIAGASAVEPLVRAAPRLGIGTLTLFALSSDNWGRPAREVDAILALVGQYLAAHVETCVRDDVRVSVIGRRDRLPTSVLESIEHVERVTASCANLRLRIAIDYSSRDAIVRAARHFHVRCVTTDGREGFGRALSMENHASADDGDVDLLVRSGGEQRLSDFLLWECAYAELVFSPKFWPDFDVTEFERCVGEFRARDRRFGKVREKGVG